jgi:hypothetical protein
MKLLLAQIVQRLYCARLLFDKDKFVERWLNLNGNPCRSSVPDNLFGH